MRVADMTLSTLLFFLISPLIGLSSTYKTISNTQSQTEPTMSRREEMMASHPPARGQKLLPKKSRERERKNQQVVNHLPNEPEILGLPYSKKENYKKISLNPLQLAGDLSKEFATYLHFPGEEGTEDRDAEVGLDNIDNEVIGIPNLEYDLAEVGEAGAVKVQRKIGKKSKMMVEKQNMGDKPTQNWLRKYYRRLG